MWEIPWSNALLLAPPQLKVGGVTLKLYPFPYTLDLGTALIHTVLNVYIKLIACGQDNYLQSVLVCRGHPLGLHVQGSHESG